MFLIPKNKVKIEIIVGDMKTIFSIFKTLHHRMSFQIYIPRDILKPYIKGIFIIESKEASDYKVIPDTAVVMGFQYSGSLAYHDSVKIKQLSKAGITGLMDTYRVFSNAAQTGTVLVVFSETGAAAFFSQEINELFSLSLSLDDLILGSQMDMVTEQLHECKTAQQRITVVENFLENRLNTKQTDELINLAVSIIKQYYGNIRIAVLAEKLHISQGRLEKRFRKVVGASPKKFASLVRMRTLVNKASKEETFTKLGLHAGYFDQAHFIKDFKSFTGETPEQFFKKI